MLVPAYNAAGHLPRLLSSAANQTKPFDEILVYDDSSTDDTSAVAKHYGARVLRGEENRGCSYAKNRLAAATTAEWIHFHDADDELLPNFGAKARHWIIDNRFDVVLFAYEARDAATGGHLAYRVFDSNELEQDAKSYAITNQINPFCGLYRREAFLRAGGYDEDRLVLYNEDVAMHIALAFAGLSFSAESEVSIINYRRTDSMSATNRLECLRAHYHVMRKTAERNGVEKYSDEIAHRLWVAVGGLAAELDWKTADKAAALAMRLGGPRAAPSGSLFKALCQCSPRAALRSREWLIRTLRPRLREGYPGWRGPINLA